MKFNEWQDYVFSDFVEINPSIRLDNKKDYSFIEMKDLSDGRKFALPSVKRKVTGGARFSNMDTLFARITPCLENGKICQATNLENNVGFGSTEFLVFRGRDKISDPDFVYYLSRSEKVRGFAVQNLVGTSGRQRVGKEAFQKLVLNLPPLSTQKKIASILSSLDDKIELNRQTNQTLEAIAQALFKEWFVDFNFPGATGEMQESELGKIPKGWRVGKLSEVLEVKYGKDHKHLESGKIPVYGSGGIMRFANRSLYEEQSILIPRKGTLSNLFYINKPFWSVDTMFYTKIKLAKGGKYLFHLLLSLNLASMNVGSAVPSLTTEILNNIPVLIPANDILTKYEKVVSSLFDQIEQNVQANQTLSKLRDILLPKLMKGELEL